MESWMATQYNDERIRKLAGICSVKIGEATKDIRKISNAINITATQGSNNKLHFEFNGMPTGEESTHRELNDILLQEFPETDIALRSMTITHKTPNILDISSDEILLDYEKHGSYPNLLMKRGFLNVRNPYYLMKNELASNFDKRWQHQLRGVLAGKKPYMVKGTQREFLYGTYKKQYIMTNQETLANLQHQLIKSWISKDIAVPSNDNVIVGGIKMPISIYMLEKRQKQISMGYETMSIENLI